MAQRYVDCQRTAVEIHLVNWNKRVQIDVVGLRDDGRTDLGECKWGPVRSAPALRRELLGKTAQYPNPRGATLHRRFFVRKRPPKLYPEPGESWHDLEDLYRR